METTVKTITIEAINIYEATNRLAEHCMLNKAFPIGVSKTNEHGVYIGEYTKKP